MSTKEMAVNIINNMTEEQLKGFVMMFRELCDDFENEVFERIKDIENGENLSETFSSVKELMEDINAEN